VHDLFDRERGMLGQLGIVFFLVRLVTVALFAALSESDEVGSM
jgi:hypothetical protein